MLIKSKNKEDEENVQSTAGGIALIGIVAALGTYVVSIDEYTNFMNSEITADICSLKNTAKLLKNPDITYKILLLDETFSKWSSALINRTYTKRNTKISGTLSGLTIGSGLFFGSATALTGGAFGIIASTCYFTWDYFSKSKKIDEEKELFEKLFVDINMAQAKILELQPNNNSYIQQTKTNIIFPLPPVYSYPQQHNQHLFAKLDLSKYDYLQQNNQQPYTYSHQNNQQMYVNPTQLNYNYPPQENDQQLYTYPPQENDQQSYTNMPSSNYTYPPQEIDPQIYTNMPSPNYMCSQSNNNIVFPKLDLSQNNKQIYTNIDSLQTLQNSPQIYTNIDASSLHNSQYIYPRFNPPPYSSNDIQQNINENYEETYV
jgi:hypothetical protein